MAAKAYDLTFSSKYVIQAFPTADDEQPFGAEAREVVDRYAVAFVAGDEGEAIEEEDPRSP